ncbi:hypothetical protein HYX02_07275 [Candidatus Woesearchaeota archaeon]|nr:hypothetical protein [Candidatus Woesearchaeota archaeon]
MRIIILLLVFMVSMQYVVAQQQCDYGIEILVGGEEFEQEDFKWRMKATKIEGIPTNITGTAKIENSDGKTIKSYKPWTSQPISKQKTSNEYTPNLKPGNYEISAEINVNCDDTNKDNNKDEKKIEIKGEAKETKSQNSKNNEVKDETTAENPNKKQIQTKSKTTQNTVTKPAKDEGADNIIQLKDKDNKNQIKPITSDTIKSTKNQEIVYISSNEKAKNLILVFLLTLSILLNIVLIWRR